MKTIADYESTTEIPDQVWEGFVAADPNGTLLQSAAWGAAKARWGWRPRRVALRRDGVLAAGAQLLFRPLALGRTIAYLPRGPVAPPDDPPLLAALFDALHRVARDEGALLLTVEPGWPLPRGAGVLEPLGFRAGGAAIQPGATLVIDLDRPEEEILGAMHQKWRYNIRLSARRGITVRAGERADFESYHRLTETTGARDAFAIRPRGYYEDVWAAFGDRARLLIAEYEGRALAAIVVVRTGRTATYLYGASSNEERNRMPNHALQWAAMRWARAEGCTAYDLWGIPDEVPEDGTVEAWGEGGLWGVYRFKQGFGGRVVKYPGPVDYPYNRIGYAAFRRYRERQG